MVQFIAGVLEQLDVALEHISKGDVHNARFSLMMTDNALELALHRYAKDKLASLRSWDRMWEKYPHKDAVSDAQGQNFDKKVKFAEIEGLISKRDQVTIIGLHDFRNKLHHAGLQHEAVLPGLASFYLDVVCRIMEAYPLRSWAYGSGTKVPDRAKKYISISERTGHIIPSGGDLARGCSDICRRLAFDVRALVDELADYMDQTIDMFDRCVQVAADGPYDNSGVSRDQAIVSAQIWTALFSDDGRKFIASRGRSVEWNEMPDLVQWMEANFPLKTRKDPVASWTRRANRVRSGADPHAALSTYLNFMKETEDLREVMADAAGQVDARINEMIDQAREK